MTIKQARTTLRKSDAPFSTVVEAAAEVARSPEAGMDDLLVCLDHGGLAAEFAVLELYRRTLRPMPANPKKLELTRAEWEQFLSGLATPPLLKPNRQRAPNKAHA
jgi:hypothetical protein